MEIGGLSAKEVEDHISTKDNRTKREGESSRRAHAHARGTEKRAPASTKVGTTNERLQTKLFAN